MLAIGCGRYQFESRPDGPLVDAPGGDAMIDAPACASTFCSDFPMGNVGWDGTNMTGTGAGSFNGDELVVVLSATSDEWSLSKNFAAPTTSFTLRARMTIATTDVGTDCELDLVRINWQSGTCALPFGFYLVRDGTGPFNLQETNGNAGCTGNRNNYTSTLENTGPHDIKLIVSVGTPGNAVLFIDGTEVYNRATLQPVPSAPILMRLGGALVRNAAAPWTITYQDVFVDVN